MRLVLAQLRALPALSLIILTAALLPAGPAGAADNQLGLFYDTRAAIDEIEVSPNTMHTLYLVLLNPVNQDYNGGGSRDVGFVAGFECGVESPAGDILLGVSFPTPAVNLGAADNIVAGFASAVPVSSQRAATLASFSVLTMGNSPVGYRLVPAIPASHPNTMAYVDPEDPDDSIVDMAPVSGSFQRPVFTFGEYKVEYNARWGEVKSLYR